MVNQSLNLTSFLAFTANIALKLTCQTRANFSADRRILGICGKFVANWDVIRTDSAAQDLRLGL